MPVLTRKVGKQIVVGDHVRVQVLAVQGSQVRLGCAAPADVPIRRHEVLPRLPAAPTLRTALHDDRHRLTPPRPHPAPRST